MANKIPPLGGSKIRERSILRWQRMNHIQKGKLLMRPSVKSKKTAKGKFNAIYKILERK